MSFNLFYTKKDLFHKVFNDEDYNNFLDIVNGKDKKISKVDISPINNYGHSLTEVYSDYLLIYLYQHIKYYLEYRNEYLPKMQEGIALCVSKAIIIDTFIPSRIDSYINFGDRRTYKANNPFEEICRMLLIGIKDSQCLSSVYNSHMMEKTSDNLRTESKKFLNLTSNLLNRNILEKLIGAYYNKDVINDIERDLEFSNVDSEFPLSATKKENREVLMQQFNRIYDLYSSKIEHGILLSEIKDNSSGDRLLTEFNNKIIYARRNIGIYEKTKRLDK